MSISLLVDVASQRYEMDGAVAMTGNPAAFHAAKPPAMCEEVG